MNLSKYIEFPRLWLLLKMELYRSRKGLLIAVVIIFGLLFTGFILENVFSSNKIYNSHSGSYAFFLLSGGFILSSLAFSDLGNPLKRSQYLTLPASTLEKFLSMWILTFIGWIILFTITFIVYAWLANAAGYLIFRRMTFIAFDPLSRLPLQSIRYYLIFQAVFLIGSVHFRGYVFPKILFTILLFVIVCGILFYAIMADIIHSGYECPGNYNPMLHGTLLQIWHGVRWFMWWLMAPLGWVIAYTGLKDQEV